MSSASSNNSPFGTYSLPAWREGLRRVADAMPVNKPGRWGASLFRRFSLFGSAKGMNGPHDIKVAEGVCARLYPDSNRCEKRAFAGVHQWDPEERAALDGALHDSSRRPFVFMDVGANIGLYSLFLNATAIRADIETKIIAIEPDETIRARFRFNCAASNADIMIDSVAIAGKSGEGYLAGGETNRGEVALSENVGSNSIPVQLQTLDEVAVRHDLSYIDAMKVDIEGHDHAALAALFKNAVPALWPQLLIVETGRDENAPALDLVLSNGYQLQKRAGINAVLIRKNA